MARQWMIEARHQKGLTARATAELLDMSEPYYCMIECGKRKPRFDLPFALAVSRVLGVPLEVIIEKEVVAGG